MEEFLVFFLSVFIFFTVINKVYKRSDVISVRSTIDSQIYMVRKLPDAKQAANKLSEINKKILLLISSVDPSKDGSKDLIENYNPRALSETLPGSKYTSYSVNKGEKISICIRKEIDDSFIDDNLEPYSYNEIDLDVSKYDSGLYFATLRSNLKEKKIIKILIEK